MEIRIKKVSIGRDVYRFSVISEIQQEVSWIGAERIHNGFGLTEKGAIEDFIRRNSYLILEEIYKEVEDAKV